MLYLNRELLSFSMSFMNVIKRIYYKTGSAQSGADPELLYIVSVIGFGNQAVT